MPEASCPSLPWAGQPPQVLSQRCLNARHPARACRICVDACPTRAISLPGQSSAGGLPVALDPQACVRCGLCLHVCPTEVFLQPEPPEARLPRVVASAPTPAVELACPRKSPPELSRVPGASVVQTPRCLAALSVPALLELNTAGKSLWLNDSVCGTCPIGQVRHAIRENLATANRWLEVSGKPPALRSYLSSPDGLSPAPAQRPVLRGDRSVMSRRDFFRSLVGRTEQAPAGPPLALSGASPVRPVRQRRQPARGGQRQLPHHVPAQRLRLNQVLSPWLPDPYAAVPTQGLPIAQVDASDACTACARCAELCPSQAITFVSDNDYYVLNFRAGLCLGDACSLCVMGCPTQAVSFGEAVSADELLGSQPRPLRAGRLVACARCGTLTHAPAEDEESAPAPLCHVCRAQDNQPRPGESLPAG